MAHRSMPAARFSLTSTLIVTLMAVTLLAVGCEKTAGGTDKAAKPGEKAADKPADKAAGGEATTADCDSYGAKLCEIAGAETPTCGSIKTVLGMLSPKACKAGLADVEYTKGRLAEMNKSCDELMNKLCADLGEETETCKMVKEKTHAFGPQKCKEMLSDYPKVLGQLKQMEEANKPLTPDKVALLSKPGAGEFGPADAKVTIVEFSDFQCPYCVRAATATTELKKKYADKVRIIFRQFPLSFHKQAHLAAQASLAAREQGKFWEMHDEMFANQKALERENLDAYAKKIGLDMGKFKAALDSGKFKADVDADMKLGEQVAVRGTPSMFMNGKRVANPTDAEAISKEIDAMLAQ